MTDGRMQGDMNLLQPGTQLDGRYEVVRLLGQGGMAAVYEVRHLGLHSTHALKVLNADLARNDDIRARFLAEGRIQARLRHPHIVQVTEIVTNPVAGLVMDYIDGPTLGELCRGQGLEPRVLLEVFLPVLDAIEEAHKHNVVHRDLKPENILVGRDSRGRLQPMVTDFGIAKMLEGEGPDGRARTQAGARMGTLLYMSPEQIRGAGEVDARTDIFALGAILYEAATGRVAFHASSDYDTMKSIVEGTYEPPERVVGGLHPVIAGCIRKALAVGPAERFQDCASFREALEKLRDADPSVPQKPSRSYAVTQVGDTPPRPEVSASEPVPESAFAPTYTPSALQRTPVNTLRSQPVPQASALDSNVSPGLAVFLSLLCISGLGQLYNGQTLKGLLGLGLSAVALANGPGGVCLWLLGYIGFTIDAYRIASKRKRGQRVGPWEFF
ncbi:serine/threonine protein kinase [Archangium violaceum]|uniref:serine/threonine protein kinase n=1 Tax=Archangium violaceum TaxID=83451 RepID=UPI00193AED1A|nr:serine/threonine-protein kinase [Archangium violaceum]QRK04512.1 serine/threonine protein kinase [Archangium violaceum]